MSVGGLQDLESKPLIFQRGAGRRVLNSIHSSGTDRMSSAAPGMPEEWIEARAGSLSAADSYRRAACFEQACKSHDLGAPLVLCTIMAVAYTSVRCHLGNKVHYG